MATYTTMALFGYPQPEEPAEKPILTRNTSGGIIGLQPYPSSSIKGQGDGVVDCAELLECTPGADCVERSYSETAEQAFGGHYIDGYGPNGCGAPLPDQTLGASRVGYRGMADEPLPKRPPAPDTDDDYDNDGGPDGDKDGDD